MSFLSTIGFLALLGGVSYLLISMEERREKEVQEYHNLLENNISLKDKFQRYRSKHLDWTMNKCIRKFFNEPERLEQAYKEKEEQERVLHKIEDERNKEYIVKRVYAYKYEDFLFSLYSPLAWYSQGDNKWFPPIAKRLPQNYIKYRMRKAGFNNIDELYKEFLQNDLLEMVYRHQGTSNQIELGCELGFTLTNYANVISEADNNIDIWIKKHGQSMSKENLMIDIDTYGLPGDCFEGSIYIPDGWVLSETRPFSNEEIEAVSNAIVVSSKYGKSVQFSMKRGDVKFLPLNPGSMYIFRSIPTQSEAA